MAEPGALLLKLPLDGEIAAGKVRGLAPQLAALTTAGWIDTRKDGRVVIVRLTAAGVDERARQETAAPRPKRAAAKAPSAAARIEALEARVAALAGLEAQVAALTARIAALEGAGRPAPDAAALRATIVAVIGELDASGRLGGLVPIPEVRAELRRRSVGATDADVTAALEELERAWTIDLSVAQAPTAVADRAAGIERPGRGLLYYVARR